MSRYVAVPEKNLVRAPSHRTPHLDELFLHALVLRPMPVWLLQVLVPDGVDDKDASQFLVNPVTGNTHCKPATHHALITPSGRGISGCVPCWVTRQPG